MREKKLRELDAFIAEHVMGWKHSSSDFYQWKTERGNEYDPVTNPFSPTTDPAAAMAVLEKIVEETEAMPDSIYIGKVGTEFMVGLDGVEAVAETLPLAIALFARDAKKLFTK